jgi:hypothetical protein
MDSRIDSLPTNSIDFKIMRQGKGRESKEVGRPLFVYISRTQRHISPSNHFHLSRSKHTFYNPIVYPLTLGHLQTLYGPANPNIVTCKGLFTWSC